MVAGESREEEAERDLEENDRFLAGSAGGRGPLLVSTKALSQIVCMFFSFHRTCSSQLGAIGRRSSSSSSRGVRDFLHTGTGLGYSNSDWRFSSLV